MPTAFANDSIQFMSRAGSLRARRHCKAASYLLTNREAVGQGKVPTTGLRAALPLHYRLLLR
jgi:hypothetical protein